MKQKLLITVLVASILLIIAALDDITTGNEPDYSGEYITLVITFPTVFVSSYFLWKNNH